MEALGTWFMAWGVPLVVWPGGVMAAAAVTRRRRRAISALETAGAERDGAAPSPSRSVTADGSEPVDTGELQDGDWEIAACPELVGSESRLAALPEPVRQLVLSQTDVLRALAEPRGNRALTAYSVTAR